VNHEIKVVTHLLRIHFGIRATGPHLKKKSSEEMIKPKHNNYTIEIFRDHVKNFLNENGFTIREKQLGLPRR